MRPVTRAPLALLAALTVLAPAAVGLAQADEDGETTSVTVAPTRAGDGYRVREQLDLPGREGESTRVVTVEEPATVRDRYGIVREAVPFLVQRRVDGEPVAAERCYGASGHIDAVQRRPLLGDGLRSGVEVAADGDGGPLWTEENPRRTRLLKSFASDPCYRRNPLAGRTLEEGDRLPLAVFWPQMAQGMRPDQAPPLRSAPAEATTFHGRDALRFTFDEADVVVPSGPNGTPVGLEGSYTFVVADGLPGVVHAERDIGLGLDIDFDIDMGCWGCPPDPPTAAEGTQGAQSYSQDWSFEIDLSFEQETELVGFSRGSGAALEASSLEPLVPPRTPREGTHGVGLRPADASAFPVSYPQETAWGDARRDPATVAYLERHPDAYVHTMTYDRGKRPAHPEDARTEGGWTFTFADEEDTYRITVSRVTGADTAAGTVESPRDAPVAERDRYEASWPAPRKALPAEVPSSAALAEALAAHGLAGDEVRRVHVQVEPGWNQEQPEIGGYATNVSYADPPEGARGVEARFDVVDSGLTRILATEPVRKEEGAWASYQPAPLDGDTSTAGFLPAGPDTGAGLAAAGAAGIGLLALLAKFVLLPLYARLRDDELLDHPVRAALHERVSEDPGLHQAALVEEAGVGKGATLHHLRKLVDADLLGRFEHGGYVRYYVPGEVTPEEARRRAVLRTGSNRDVYEALAEDPGRSLRDVAGEVGVSAPTVHRCLEQLREAGLVDDEDRPLAHVDAPRARA